MQPNNQQPKGQGLAIASLTLGILAVVTSLFWFISIILGVIAIVFGAVSLKSGPKKSIAGITTGAVGIILSILLAIVIQQVAVPSLQKSQRDTARKNDISILASDVSYRMTMDQGQLPDVFYVNDMTYKLDQVTGAVSGGDTEPTTSTAVYQAGVNCDGETSLRNYSITILLENGSEYCQGS